MGVAPHRTLPGAYGFSSRTRVSHSGGPFLIESFASLDHATEAVHLTDVTGSPHYLSAVGVVAERCVALNRIELATAEVLLHDPYVVRDAAVPVEDGDVAWQRGRPSFPHAGGAEPGFNGRNVGASLGSAAGA